MFIKVLILCLWKDKYQFLPYSGSWRSLLFSMRIVQSGICTTHQVISDTLGHFRFSASWTSTVQTEISYFSFPLPLPPSFSLSFSSFLPLSLFSLSFVLPPCTSLSYVFTSMNFLFMLWLYRDFYFKIQWLWDFPSDPVVGSLPSSSGDESSIPDQATKIPHATGQLSL